MRIIFGSLIALLTITGCKSNPVKLVESRDYFLREFNWTREPVNGKNAYVSVTAHDPLSPDMTNETNVATQQWKDALKNLGYTLVEARVDADLWVDFEFRAIHKSPQSETMSIMDGEKTVSSRVLSDIDGKTYELILRGSAQVHKKRPKLLFQSSIKTGTQKRLSALLKDQNALWLKELPELVVVEPKVKPAGKPGCIPRFGFETTVSRIGDTNTHMISKVQAGSGAEKAGLQVDDQIVAIDSMDYDSFASSENAKKIYEKLTSVPIKLLRAKKEVRSNIKPQISCE